MTQGKSTHGILMFSRVALISKQTMRMKSMHAFIYPAWSSIRHSFGTPPKKGESCG